MKTTIVVLGLALALSACGKKPECTFKADGVKMEGFNNAACEKMSLGYNAPK
jgi:hypothetical protein